ncbi:SpoIIIAH-like family protein [Peribacillus asahii]|uniref:SpoIIIAH-like family protein n=1 Tax=Peribacillus asahii TaxID=228899 RepID=UPI00207A776C|nr:SpoIIIAH-like family protein [Peribacillus asahii]USK69123.1 SpoIIIAH-like family protein [Peribacillus asahii]USK83987.1 SpoIIIAH-like family protein [Peribacillus asahii]
MLLKKQTVWLLTMLSLVVVLSVYYLTSPESVENAATTEQQKNEQNENAMVGDEMESESVAKPDANDTKKEEQSDTKSDTKSDEKAEKDSEASVAITSGDDTFDALRMQIDDERSKLSQELTEKMGNTELSTEERNAAYEAVEQLSEIKVKENILEGMIVSLDFDAALVRVDGDDVKVTVKAEEQSAADANKIMRLVRGEIEEANDISVEFQVGK